MEKKCRTCLRNSTKTVQLNECVKESKTKSTYGQLLQECASLEYSADYEHLMPQNLCTLCCQELSKAYTFIQQAQYCNNKLINLLMKKLQKAFIKSESGEEIEVEKQQNIKSFRNKFKIVNTSVLLKPIEVEQITEHNPIPLKDNENNSLQSSADGEANTASNTVERTTCPICQKTINGLNCLKSHMRIQHEIEAPNKYLGKKKTTKIKCVKTTKKQKPKERVFKCSWCNYIARTYGAIDFHNRSKHGTEDDKFKCNFCPYTTWTKFKLFKHLKKSHKDQIKALKAENKVDQSENIEDMGKANENSSNDSTAPLTEMVINSSSFGDTFCTTNENRETEDLSDDLFLRNILNIKKRQYQTVSTNLLPRRCDECGNIYNNIQALKTHKKNVHISEEQYVLCPHCDKKFKKRCNMRVHIRNAHNPNLIKIRKKPTTNQTKEKSIMCSQCSYVCCTNTLLTHHVNRHHTGEKPYKCDFCTKSFVVAFDLKIHRYIHTGERPYKCSICLKCFRSSADLIKHKRIHNNERPYKCQDCEKSFTQSYNLTLHKRTHIKAKNLKCMVCNNFFENQSLLNAHRVKEDHYDEIE